ncbi:Galactose oxidase/kelch beta-propeller [Penicillium coprophilum]|uniref:Galactose oxidase/kelch beta-propeller n=1 Tax=Penicillium coprophilum TaxID=36646 RepID=UPI002394BE74|nr:Galactose oxidase/kelch beta-propeller [Penicillium coprophilum]KAJ5158868.1 Galactose oxidase/kelch beta-propeller [Penicillium coprophilum]
MTGPKPLFKIEGDCSTIHSNTLYVYSPEGFASIPLEENKGWHKLPSPDHKVTGPACVQSGSGEDEDYFYLVGGTGSPDSPDNSGLQRFSFRTEKWETLLGQSQEMKDRTGHGAGYIPSTSEILVYAGNKDGSTQISQSTLFISTQTTPFDVRAGTDQGTPALYEPIILPWSSSEVAMIGGSATNTAVYIYDSNKGWSISEATLPSAIQPSSRCALASDASGNTKVLEEFTMIASPNTATSYLLSSKGKMQNPVTAIAPLEKRDITDSYNGTFAPTASWSDYTLAQGNGLVVLASGQSNDSLAIFNQTSNAWVNSTELFYGKPDQHVLKPSTTSFTSSTPTSTTSTSTSTSTSASSTPTSSSPVVAAVGGGLSDHGKTILGATLGSVLGFGLILLIILLLLRRERKKRQVAKSGGSGDNKDRLSFQDQGIEPLTEGAYPMARSPVPLAAASTDSLAIMSGNYKGEKSLKPPGATGYGLSPQPKASSPLSTIPSSGVLGASSVYTDDTSRAGDDRRENQAADRMTDEGWGKYFEDGGATNFQSDRSTISSAYTKSDYRGSGWPMTTLTPLNFGFLEQPQPLGRVFSGSPTTEHGPSDMGNRSLVIPESQSARISSADSISVASDDDRDDPKWQGAGQSSWLGRPTSSNYTASIYQTSAQEMPWQSSNPSFADKPRQSNARRSSVIIPHDIDELPMQGQKNNTNSDMSWLNLKADR